MWRTYAEAAAILEEYGWQNDFALYFHEDRIQVRLYLRMAYVASCYLDGTWSDIKERIPYIIPLLLAATELRKEKNLGMLWIDRQVTKLDWSKTESSMNDWIIKLWMRWKLSNRPMESHSWWKISGFAIMPEWSNAHVISLWYSTTVNRRRVGRCSTKKHRTDNYRRGNWKEFCERSKKYNVYHKMIQDLINFAVNYRLGALLWQRKLK